MYLIYKVRCCRNECTILSFNVKQWHTLDLVCHRKKATFNRSHMVSYQCSIVTMTLICSVCQTQVTICFKHATLIPSLICHPIGGWSHSNFRKVLVSSKTRLMWLQRSFDNNTFLCFDTLPDCDIQMDRRTDRQTFKQRLRLHFAKHCCEVKIYSEYSVNQQPCLSIVHFKYIHIHHIQTKTEIMQTYGLKHMEQFLHFLRTTHIKTAKKNKNLYRTLFTSKWLSK